jgi:alpha-D-xyloside xylohydrolase
MPKSYAVRALIVALLCVAPLELRAATETLLSSALQLEVTTNPYTFRILDRSTGDVLLVHSRTAFNEVPIWVTDAAVLNKSGNSLTAALTLAGGGKAQITFTFTRPEVLQINIRAGDASASEVFEEFKDQGEHYYGIWEYPFEGAIDNRNADDDFLGLRRLPDVNYASARAPFYLTSRKYAIYVESTARGHYAVARESRTSFTFAGNNLTYDIIYGPSYADMLQRYNVLGGASLMPPTWAFDSIWWRDDHHHDLRDVTDAQEKVIDDADRLRKLRIPASAIWLDRPYGTGDMGWGNMDFDASFPSPQKMVRDLADRGMFLLVWVANRNSNSTYEEGAAKGYMFDGPWSAADLRRPEVYDWFKKKLDVFVRLGIKGYKIDRGEENELPRSTENLHAILLPKLAAEGMAAVNGQDFFNFTRNVNDTARKYTAVWNGDTRATFGGLAISVKTGLRSGAINFPMWGSDTGGYIGQPSKELFARWLEFSAYSPMMEVLIGPRRTIWYDYDDELVEIARRYATDHHDLIPYTRSAMYQATQTGMPVMRSLIFAYPADQKLYDMWDEYLFGDAILAAPVTGAGITSRNIYLPAGQWLDYNDRKTSYRGGSTISANAPLGTIPLFVREGAIIPRGDIVKTNNNWEQNWTPKLRVEFFPSETAVSHFDYYTGSAVRAIDAGPKAGGLEISFDDLSAAGSLEIYWNGATQVARNGRTLKAGADYSYDEIVHRITVPFTGATKLSIEGGRSVFAAR